MSQSYELESGVAERLHLAEPNDEQLFNTPHTLQVLSVKPVGNGAERYRVILSDGVYFLQSMLATQLNSMITDQQLGKHTVIVTEKFSCNFVQEKRLLILMALRILGQPDDKIGDPENIQKGQKDGDDSAVPSPAVQKPSSSAQQQRQTHQPQQRQPQAQNRSSRSNLHPIEALSPYASNWTVKALVTQKSELRQWSNARGEGKLFSFTLTDESGEIRVTAFNAQADELADVIQEKKVYYVSKAKITLAKKKFSNVQNEYEMTIERGSEVELCTDTTDVPTIKYNFIPLKDLAQLSPDSICDVIAVVKHVGDIDSIMSQKTNRQYTKRDLTLVDKSKVETRFTLWGKLADNFTSEQVNTIIAVKGAKVGDFNGRNISAVASTQVDTDPDHPDTFALRGWYDSGGSAEAFDAQPRAAGGKSGGGSFRREEQKTLAEVKAIQPPATAEETLYFSNRATVMHIKDDNIAYPACGVCNKKVVQDRDSWRCEKCDKPLDGGPTWRFIVAMAVSDYTGQEWFQGFNETGEAIFGMSGNEVVNLKENDEAQYRTLLQRSIGQTFNFVCRAKSDSYNDQLRVRKGVIRLQKPDYVEETKLLLDLIDTPWAQ